MKLPFVNSVKYHGVIFDEKVTWRLHIEMIETKDFRTFIRIYFLFKSERISTYFKLTLHKALIRRCTPPRDLHMAFKLPYIYDYITKVYRQQTEVTQNHENATVRNTGKGETRHRKYKRLKLGSG
jgi:hypothetical protein